MQPEAASSSPASRRWTAFATLAAIVVIATAYPSLSEGVRNWDNVVKLQVAENIILGDGPIVGVRTPDDDGYVLVGKDGRRYTGYPPLAYVLQFPTILWNWMGGPIVEGLPALLLLGLTAAVIIAWGRRCSASLPAAATGALLTCLGTALWPMATHGYDNQIEVLALAVLLWAAASPRPSHVDWTIAGVAFGGACATRLGAALLAIPAAVLLAADLVSKRTFPKHALAFGAGAIPGVAAVLWFNFHRFGTLLAIPTSISLSKQDLHVPWFSRAHLEGIAGLLVSPGKGLPWYNPPLLVAIVLLPALVRRHRAVYAALGAYAVVSTIALARLTFWHGEWGWGPRYLAPLCLAAAPLAWFLVEKGSRTRNLAMPALALAVLAAWTIQAFPASLRPVDLHLMNRVRQLVDTGELVTRPFTRPPLPADNGLLYFTIENSAIVTLARVGPEMLRDPVFGPPARKRLCWAMLAPVGAAALVGAALLLGRRDKPR